MQQQIRIGETLRAQWSDHWRDAIGLVGIVLMLIGMLGVFVSASSL